MPPSQNIVRLRDLRRRVSAGLEARRTRNSNSAFACERHSLLVYTGLLLPPTSYSIHMISAFDSLLGIRVGNDIVTAVATKRDPEDPERHR